MSVTLRLRAPLDEWIEVDGVTADRLGSLSERDIAGLPVWIGRRGARLGDFFEVRGAPSAHVRIEGDLRRVDGLGAGMRGGELIVEGDAGPRTGARMEGGRIDVRGSVGDEAGLAMRGGILRIHGHAGDRLGAAAAGASKGMAGGEIVVSGGAGAEVGRRMRRGLIAVGGSTGERPAEDIIAGTVIVLGRTGAGAGRGSKRGSVVAIGGIDVPATYRYACTFEPPYLRLALRHLQRQYALAIDERAIMGRYRRYCGDAGHPGKGEILEYVPSDA